MDETNYTYYEIDISDIWGYERDQFLDDLSSNEDAQKLMDLVQHYIIKNNVPNFGISRYDNGDDGEKGSYNRMLHEYIVNIGDLKSLYSLDYFFFNNDCYDYYYDIIIKANDANFPYFFSLKLRQYIGDLFELDNFLTYQFKKSFKNNETKYKDFLRKQLWQYSNYFPDSIKTIVGDFKPNVRKRTNPVRTQKLIDNEEPAENQGGEFLKRKPTVWQYALFYVYIITSKEYKRLDQIAVKRKDAFAKIAAKLHLSENSFELHFGFYNKDKIRNGKIESKKRTYKAISDDIQFVIDNMLAKYPKAVALAKKDLDQLKIKT